MNIREIKVITFEGVPYVKIRNLASVLFMADCEVEECIDFLILENQEYKNFFHEDQTSKKKYGLITEQGIILVLDYFSNLNSDFSVEDYSKVKKIYYYWFEIATAFYYVFKEDFSIENDFCDSEKILFFIDWLVLEKYTCNLR